MSKKVLVVDDDPEIVQLLSFNLKQAGFSVGSAANGFDALRKANATSPDLIVLDLMLPELDGFAVCEILRHDPVTASTPIIMLTALASELARLSGLDSGANEYIVKPFSPKSLVGRVQELLGVGQAWKCE